jgi:signal transduction histidine kinase
MSESDLAKVGPRFDLRSRLVASSVLILLLATAGYGVFVFRRVERSLRDELTRSVANAADTAALQLDSRVAIGDVERPISTGPLRTPVVQFHDERGMVLRTIDPFPGSLPAEAESRGVRPEPDLDTLIGNRGWIFRERTVQLPEGSVRVTAALPSGLVDDALVPLRRALIAGGLALVVAAGLTSWFLASSALRPLRRLRTDIAAVETAARRTRVTVPETHPDAAGLALAVNQLIARTEQARSKERRFVADASHELRTPLTTLRTELEIAGNHPTRTDWATLAPELLAETDRLANLVDSLLLLARLDHDQLPSPTPLAIDQLVVEAASRRGILARSTGPADVFGNAELLTAMLTNLIDNAQAHASSNVEISIELDDRQVTINVDDDGPGIPPQDRLRVFDRFERIDPSRERSDRGGTGIGLSLVQTIADAHQGHVSITESPIGGARFSLALPRHERDQP